MELDLSSFDSIKRFVEEFQSRYSRLDVLINNAGVLCHHPTKTKENVEYTIGVNYLGHYVLTEQLFPLMCKGTRIINTVSIMLRYGKIQSDFFAFPHRRFNKFACYSHSKLALYYAALDWAEKWKEAGCMVNCVDPGIVNTNIIRMGNKLTDKCCDLFFRPFIRTPQQGADSIIYLATNNNPEFVTGQLFKSRKIKQISPLLQDRAQRDSLALQTQQFLNKYL
jgi:NAD(P)-dependent dehydrogenase (short-subunit alcohol dehydrogenase family)